MFDDLPSASRRAPLATGRALAVAVLLHAAVGAAIILSGSLTGGTTPAAESPENTADARTGDAPRVPAIGHTPAVSPGTPDTAGTPGTGSAGAPTAQPAGEPAPAEAGAVALAELPAGAALSQVAAALVIDAPDTMRLGERYEVRLSLPPNVSTPPTDTLRPRTGLSPVRQATLVGDKILVEPRTRALQLADSAAPTVWRWMVTPTEPGRARLAAELSVVHYRRGEERIASLRGIQKQVHVQAGWAQHVSRFLAAQWFWVVLFTILVTTGWLRSRLGS